MIVVGACEVASAAQDASVGPENERLLYDFMFGGLRVGEVLVTLHEADGRYRSEMRAKARGLLKTVMGDFRADLAGLGHVSADGPVRWQPEEFRRAWTAGQWASLMVVTFDPVAHMASSHERLFHPATGEDIAREDLPWNRHKRASRPPTAQRIDAFDPMTAFLVGRDLIRRNWQTGGPLTAEKRLPVFDGRHRYDVVMKQEAAKAEDFRGVVRQVIPVTVRTEPTGGFEADTAKHTREGQGRIAFSADERFIPLQIVVGNSLGTGVFNLIADCNEDPARCDAFALESKILETPAPGSTP